MSVGILSIFWVLPLIFWIWMLVDCLMNPNLKDVQKLTWVVVIVFTNVIGAAIYWAIGRNQPTTYV